MSPTTLAAPCRIQSGLSAEDLKRQVLSAFDALRPGEKVTLTIEGDASAVLSLLQRDRKGQFDWTPVREGANSMDVEVSRRDAARGSLRTVNEALSWDHDRLDDLEARAFKARERSDFADAKDLYAVFAFGLRRHIRFEEELLFPAFEARTGFPKEAGPTAVMRDEHLEILTHLERIEQGIGDGAASLDSLRHGLHLVLGNHNLKEEHIVYPMTDRALGEAEGDALVARIQAI